MAKPIELTDQNFQQEVLEADKPVLVDFWAVWCGPCQYIAPMIEQLAGDFDGKAKVGKLNVDDQTETARRYGIRAIPTLLFFKGGAVVDRLVGVADPRKLAEKLQALV